MTLRPPAPGHLLARIALLSFSIAASLLGGSQASAGVPVRVTLQGSVEFNGFASGPLSNVDVGEGVTLSCLLDSASFVNSGSFPTRGYAIDKPSFRLQFAAGSMGLQNPFPAGQTPYFVLRNNDPGVDGFFISTNVDVPAGVPLPQVGSFGNVRNDSSVTYGPTAIPSLDILQALGTYDFTGLSVYNWTIDDGPFNPMGIVFESLVIERADAWESLGGGTPGSAGQPLLEAFGTQQAGADTLIELSQAPPGALMLAWLSFQSVPLAALGGTVYANPFNAQFLRVSSPSGTDTVAFAWPAGTPSGVDLYLQYLVQDLATLHDITLSHAVTASTP